MVKTVKKLMNGYFKEALARSRYYEVFFEERTLVSKCEAILDIMVWSNEINAVDFDNLLQHCRIVLYKFRRFRGID